MKTLGDLNDLKSAEALIEKLIEASEAEDYTVKSLTSVVVSHIQEQRKHDISAAVEDAFLEASDRVYGCHQATMGYAAGALAVASEMLRQRATEAHDGVLADGRFYRTEFVER